MDYKIEQLRKILHMKENSKDEDIILSAKAMMQNIELILVSTTDNDVKRIAKSKLQMIQQYLPVNMEEQQNFQVQGEVTATGGRGLIRIRLCNDKYLSVEDRDKMERAVAGDESAEADYIRAVLEMKRVGEKKNIDEVLKDIYMAFRYIKTAHDKEPDNKLYDNYYRTLERLIKTWEKRKKEKEYALKQREKELERQKQEWLEREAQEAEEHRKEAEEQEKFERFTKLGGRLVGVLSLVCVCSCCYRSCQSGCSCLGC